MEKLKEGRNKGTKERRNEGGERTNERTKKGRKKTREVPKDVMEFTKGRRKRFLELMDLLDLFPCLFSQV